MTIKTQSYYYEKAVRLTDEVPLSRQTYIELTKMKDEMASSGLDDSVMDSFIELSDIGSNSLSEEEKLQLKKIEDDFLELVNKHIDNDFDDFSLSDEAYCGTSTLIEEACIGERD